MTDHKRHAPIAQPTAERTADQSTQSASGLGADRPGVDPERHDQDVRTESDLSDEARSAHVDLSNEARSAESDPVMPSDDPSLNTKI